MDPILQLFHPAVGAWFAGRFGAPTEPQRGAWPLIHAGRPVLLAAPTGSGKTLAAFLAAIDDLVRRGLLEDGLPDAVQVVYVSPLKALSNDVEKNLQEPLAGIAAELAARGLPDPGIRTLVRTGDTPQSARAAMARKPPHVLVTTPESLYLLLTSDSGRRVLGTARTVIVDEIHAVADDKRGSHLALTLERLEDLVERNGGALLRVGLSATQKPIEEVARFLMGNRPDRPGSSGGAGAPKGAHASCDIVDSGHRRALDLALELPGSPLEAVMSAEVWSEVYDRLAELIREHRTTLVFTNTRRHAERVTRHLSERLGEGKITSHHGSLARPQRLEAEQRLKAGELSALVATASLELGIDIGAVDLVCQLGSTRSIAGLLQRVGRSGHHLGGLPKGRVFPQTRDELVECAALLDAVRRGELDRLIIPHQPIDILAQQIVAAVAVEEWGEDELFELMRRAYPFRDLTREQFDEVVEMLAEGFSTRRGRRGAYLHHDAVNGRLRGRKGARLAALTSGGAIPDTGDYQVVQEPAGHRGRHGARGLRGREPAGRRLPARQRLLAHPQSRARPACASRTRAARRPRSPSGWARRRRAPTSCRRRYRGCARRWRRAWTRGGTPAAVAWLEDEVGTGRAGGGRRSPSTWRSAGRRSAPCPPRARWSPSASSTRRATCTWCSTRRSAAASTAPGASPCASASAAPSTSSCRPRRSEDAIVLSLGPTHSFPLADVFHFLHSATAREVLIQALLDSPLFGVRWRWNASRALALPRWRGGRKVPAPLQRQEAEDLVAVVFPDQLACLENIVGEREVPDHPLIAQTIEDCLTEAMDVEGLERLLRGIESGAIETLARDLVEPSPLAHEILNSAVYTFLDDAPLEERRTRAVAARRWIDPETAADLGALDGEAIERVRMEAWPDAETPDELHDALVTLGFVSAEEGGRAGWGTLFEKLAAERRAAVFQSNGGPALWVAAERLPQLLAVYGETIPAPADLGPPVGSSVGPSVGSSVGLFCRFLCRGGACLHPGGGKLRPYIYISVAV